MNIKLLKDKINDISKDEWVLVVVMILLIVISFGYMLLHI